MNKVSANIQVVLSYLHRDVDSYGLILFLHFAKFHISI